MYRLFSATQDDGVTTLKTERRGVTVSELTREAIETLLHTVKLRGEHRDDARSQLLELFTVLGDDDPLVRDARPRLASALF